MESWGHAHAGHRKRFLFADRSLKTPGERNESHLVDGLLNPLGCPWDIAMGDPVRYSLLDIRLL